ncbi:MAG TPA: hypothetical protein VGU24_07750 [Microvirga sp.]|jgi:hypothetical protein|nr:hypothetical protein [Microvirga sp.]
MRLDGTLACVTRGIEPATANRSPLLHGIGKPLLVRSSKRVPRRNVM